MDVKKLVKEMTLEEKASLCSGMDSWHTKPVDRLSVPAMMVSDGPHGLRKQDDKSDHLGINESIKAVCFPAGCALAASFDRELLRHVGETIGNECQAEDLGVILGPAMNIKRSPLCGRNFEYFSEDPYLAGEMAVSHVKGVQSKGVGTSIKHFLANSQEHRRMSSDSRIDERTLREIYLPAFEKAVKEAQPWTVMCSYNKVNGTYASENKTALTDILRDEWGFEGFVMSDWGAVNDRVKGIRAGLELEMPSSGGINDKKIVDAVKSGELPEEVVDVAVERILNIVYKYIENRQENAVWDKEADHAFSREAAAECMVLLKNDNNVLPLNKTQKVAFIGEFAKKPRYQGGGSSHINSFCVDNSVDEAVCKYQVSYAKGYSLDKDVIDEELAKEAVNLAAESDVAVVFAGLPDAYESEGYDRSHMKMPQGQEELIRRVAGANKNTVVVLYNGSPVEMPWEKDVAAILEAYLGGQAAGSAVVDVLYGIKNPCGKLPETFPLKLEDNPSYLYYFGEKDVTEYREGIFTGYRYYDKKKMDVLYPFGHGLSYTTFALSNLKLDKEKLTDKEMLKVTVDVENTGDCFGKEVVQLYIAPKESKIIRPVKELKDFEKVALNPGEKKTVVFELDSRAFAYWNTEIHDWHVESGAYDILAGQSSRNIACSKEVYIQSCNTLPKHYDENSLFGDLLEDEQAKALLEPLITMVKQSVSGNAEEDSVSKEAISDDMTKAMMKYMPLRGMRSFGGTTFKEEDFQKLLQELAAIGKS
ncbi:MAG TPA: glycosyl hydrolase [Lachnospiraceae bacterium]|nr:glycosyl hydrolase [Lachnospiraceae bacterium]